MKRNSFLFILCLFFVQSVYSQNADKIPLDHSVYEKWKELDHAIISNKNESHNLTRWPNRKDLSIRMFQFYDYYLKGDPKPAWMINGIPAIEKGREDGYRLEEHN